MRRLRYKRKKREADDASSRTPLTQDQIRQRTFARAIKLLAARSRSVAELRELLLEGRSNKAAVEETLERLREYGYVDDERFAFGYASLKVRQRPVGRQRVRRDLVMKKIDGAVVDEALDLVFAEVSEETLIDRAIEKRIRLRGRPKNRAEAKSLIDHLLRQGFPFELVSEKVRATALADLDEEV